MERVVRIVAAVLVLAGGIVHLQLWNDGYKDIPDVGPAFLANVIASFVVAVALVLWPHWAAIVAGLAVVNGTLMAFTLSRTDQGIFDFTERGWQPSPEAALALVFEVAAGIALVWLLWRSLTDHTLRPDPHPSVSG